jgi:CheY-like chemotaxis protein
LVDLLGGRIWVESKPGQGTSFHFTFDIELAEKPAPAAIAYLSHKLPVAGKQQHILLVEDTLVNQQVAKKLLNKWNFAVTIAENGQRAVNLYQAQEFDLVLMDIQMPIMNGLEATRHIRDHEQRLGLPRTPIIAITANAMQADNDACLASGMDDFIAKPFRADDMLAAIQRHFETPAIA